VDELEEGDLLEGHGEEGVELVGGVGVEGTEVRAVVEGVGVIREGGKLFRSGD